MALASRARQATPSWNRRGPETLKTQGGQQLHASSACQALGPQVLPAPGVVTRTSLRRSSDVQLSKSERNMLSLSAPRSAPKDSAAPTLSTPSQDRLARHSLHPGNKHGQLWHHWAALVVVASELYGPEHKHGGVAGRAMRSLCRRSRSRRRLGVGCKRRRRLGAGKALPNTHRGESAELPDGRDSGGEIPDARGSWSEARCDSRHTRASPVHARE